MRCSQSQQRPASDLRFMDRHVLLLRKGLGRFVSRTIHAVGGIAVRKGGHPKVAVVQRSKDKRWVLPRGKLRRDERPVAGARREVVEETGFRVEVCEFLGVITYRSRGRPKVVQFWLMWAEAEPSFELMKDIIAVKWLSLDAAVKRLSYPLEKLFLTNVGHHAVQGHRRRQARKGKPPASKPALMQKSRARRKA
jgi:8-oxo-dGTP diphosphatase